MATDITLVFEMFKIESIYHPQDLSSFAGEEY